MNRHFTMEKTGMAARTDRLIGLVVAAAASIVLGGCTLFGGMFGSVQILADGKAVSSYDFGALEQAAGTSKTVQLTVSNMGSLPIDLSGSGAPTVSGSAASDFKVSGLSATTVDGQSTATFSVTFTPSAVGRRSATLTVQPFAGSVQTLTLSGFGGVGQIVVSDANEDPIPEGGTYDAGGISSGSNVITVYVTNPSTLNALTLSATEAIVDSPDGSFSFGAPTSSYTIAANGGGDYLMLNFNPPDSSEKTATVTINNSATGSFTFTISAVLQAL